MPKRKVQALSEVDPSTIANNNVDDATETTSNTALPTKKSKTSATVHFKLTPSTADAPNFLKAIVLPIENEFYKKYYENCNAIRAKIRKLLASGVKQTHFLKWLDVNSNSYRFFMSYRDPWQGVDNCVYRSAYLFFEKLRIVEGKGKSKARLQVEKDERGRKKIRSQIYEINGLEEECVEDEQGRLVLVKTGKVVKLI